MTRCDATRSDAIPGHAAAHRLEQAPSHLHFWQQLIIVLAADIAIALLLGAIFGSFSSCLVYSQAIGLLIFLFSKLLHRTLPPPHRHWLTPLIGIPSGGLAGITLGRVWEGFYSGAHAKPITFLAGTALLFGGVLSYYFHSHEALTDQRIQLREELLRRAEAAQRLAETELKLLQAQIEPHFLFNTLSNVASLVEGDPQGAKRMLQNLTHYLRCSLRRTRSGATTLGEELELVRAYLEIQSVRMGNRLSWEIACPAPLRALPLPPLLLQPLVENAVRHGLEPSPTGGAVTIEVARTSEDQLIIEVNDTGIGMASNASGSGLGMANVRARLLALSNGRGRMLLRPAAPHGLRVRLELPLPGPSLPRSGDEEAVEP